VEGAGLLSVESRAESAAKQLPATAAIFDQVAAVNRAADAADTELRLSMEATATGTVGPLARGGQSRVPTVAAEHDFHPDAPGTPVGLSLLALAALCLSGITSPVTRDGLVDCLMRWWEGGHHRFAPMTPVVINLENGPENQSRRTPCRRRIVEFAHPTGLPVRLASSPPYHSKYNPLERCWGSLEHHWNGARLDAIDAGMRFATTRTWQGKGPVVALVTTT